MTIKQRDKYLKRKYGIGIKEYNRMFKAQGGVCAVCGRPPKKGKNLHVDHDHYSGEVRGLLDYYCNRRIIGRNKEDTVRKLVKYIMPNFDLVINNLDMHMLEVQTRHLLCNCLGCVREEVNRENTLLKS
jgi:hypothetical protein